MPSEDPPVAKGPLTWRPTKMMNMRDLSKDDDFLSHLLVEKLGTGSVPLLVHKMDSSRRLPKTDAQDLLQIVRRLVNLKAPVQQATRQAVDELLRLNPIRYYLKTYTQPQINAFATHASRYFELYHPSGSIEIAHTSRYSHRTGKSELCILSTRHLQPGSVITELKGSMADLTDEEDRELKRTGLRNTDIRRDFSVIHSKSLKKNHLFLGPARFVNHDCENNCELFREGRYITFRVIKPIPMGDEITAHYGDGYFGKRNRHCLCATCERRGRGGYAPENSDDEESSSDSSSDSDSDTSDSDLSSSDTETDAKKPLNLNERRTRRGVYAIVRKDKDKEDGSSDVVSIDDLDRLSSSASCGPSTPRRPLTTESDLTSLNSSTSSPLLHGKSRLGAVKKPVQLVTPPLSEESTSVAGEAPTPNKRVTRSSSQATPRAQRDIKGKGKEKETEIITTSMRRKQQVEDIVKVKTEEVEPRLRGRPSLSSKPAEPAKGPPSKPVPRGPDGKPLPTCMTCHSLMPVISLDSHVVGSTPSTPSKKKGKEDCPRCLRHAAIYNQAWPRRIPLPGSFLPTPQDDGNPESPSKRISKKSLSIIDRKLAAAASTSPNKYRGRLAEEPPAKKRKIVSISAPVIKSKPVAPVPAPPPMPPPPEVKRKRGRPTLAELAARKAAEKARLAWEAHIRGVKVEDVEMTLSAPAAVPAAPRVKLSRAERAVEREKNRVKEKASVSQPTSPQKRPNEAVEEVSRKRARHGEELLQPLRKIHPKATPFRHGIINSAPEIWSSRAWAEGLLPQRKDRGPVLKLTERSETETLVVSMPIAAVTAGAGPDKFSSRRWSSISARNSPATATGMGKSRLSLPDDPRLDSPESDLHDSADGEHQFMTRRVRVEDAANAILDPFIGRGLQFSYPAVDPYTPRSASFSGAFHFAKAEWDSDSSDV